MRGSRVFSLTIRNAFILCLCEASAKLPEAAEPSTKLAKSYVEGLPPAVVNISRTSAAVAADTSSITGTTKIRFGSVKRVLLTLKASVSVRNSTDHVDDVGGKICMRECLTGETFITVGELLLETENRRGKFKTTVCLYQKFTILFIVC